jgi:hypothetical protein
MAINQMMGGQVLVQQDPAAKRRRMMAEQMMQEGASTAPVSNVWEGLARVVRGGVGGYLGNKEDGALSERQDKANKALAEALTAGRGQAAESKSYDDGHVIDWNAVAPDKNKMYATLLANPDTAGMGAQMQLGDMENQEQWKREDDVALRGRGWSVEDREYNRTNQIQDMQTQRGWQVGDRNQARNWQLTDRAEDKSQKAVRLVSGDEIVKLGFAPGTVLSMDGYGNASVVQSPKDATGAGGGIDFGNSADAKAVKFMIENGQMTPTDGARWLAGKAVPGPDGSLQFLSPDAMFAQQQAAQGIPPQGGGGQGALMTLREGTGPKFTQDQTNAATFAERMAAAENSLEPLQNVLTDPGQKFRASVPMVGNYLTSPEYQQAKQGQEDWVTANLRKESGATIGDEEMAREINKYFPQPGDSPEVIARKSESRKIAAHGMTRAAGSALPQRSEIANAEKPKKRLKYDPATDGFVEVQ